MIRQSKYSLGILAALAVATGAAVHAAAPGEKPAEAKAPAPAVSSAEDKAPLPTELPSWTASFPSDDGLSNEARDGIQQEARTLAKTLPAGSPLRAELFARLGKSPRCGRAHSAAVAGAFSLATPAEIVSALGSMKTDCNEVLIESAGFAPEVDASLVNAVQAYTKNGDPAQSRAAWLAYGSLGETARRAGSAPIADGVEATLASALAPAKGESRVLMVKAAGNAGCRACAGELAKDVRSPDLALRRAAVAAHRFLDDTSSVEAMCTALAKDGDDAVRDMAAWALEWRGNDAARRADCLDDAARRDTSKRVRMQATLALGVLADDHREATKALLGLADSPELDVAPLATQALAVRNQSPAPLLAALEREE
jgi:hypothetical protein